jgi:hypothetical protein
MNNTTIFYSWQSNHKDTKNFINKALKNAINDLSGSNILEKAPRLDKDTQGLVGSPNIVSTIKDKIDGCGIFVADVSIIDESKSGKKLVNQNVMFELGYAIAKHTEMNVVMLLNSDLGDPKDLPFDISHHRVLQFSIKNDDKKGTELKNKLVGALTAHLNSLAEQDVLQVEQTLDDIQLLTMRIFANMSDDKRIMVISTMGGSTINPVEVIDDNLLAELNKLDAQEVVANMDDLVNSGVLTIDYGSKGTPSYRPTKQGYEIIKILNGNKNNLTSSNAS